MAKVIKFEGPKPEPGRRQLHGELKMATANESGTGRATMTFYGDIVSTEDRAWSPEDRTPKEVADFVNSLDPTEEIDLYFNSPGGDARAGIAIKNILDRHPAAKTGVVDGIVASSAVTILMACQRKIFYAGSQAMIHDPWALAQGNAGELRKTADRLDDLAEEMADIYAGGAAEGVTREQMRTWMKEETWANGQKAKTMFSGVEVVDTQAVPAASAMYDMYDRTPAEVTAQLNRLEKSKTPTVKQQIAALAGDLDNYGI